MSGLRDNGGKVAKLRSGDLGIADNHFALPLGSVSCQTFEIGTGVTIDPGVVAKETRLPEVDQGVLIFWGNLVCQIRGTQFVT
jgi:hypothetical protein